MSFDICVFFTEKPQSDDDAANRYEVYCKEEHPGPWIEPSLKVANFVSELTKRYPEIEDVPDEDVDDCPWSTAFDISDGHVLISMAFSMADQVLPYVVELTTKHNLVCFDPQAGQILAAPPGIYVVESEPSPIDEARVMDSEVAPFVAMLDELLKPRGFTRRVRRWRKDGDLAIVAVEFDEDIGGWDLCVHAWFKEPGQTKPTVVKEFGEFHLSRSIKSRYLAPEREQFLLTRALQLHGDWAEFITEYYENDRDAQETILGYFEPFEPLTMEWRVNTLRQITIDYMLPLMQRMEAGDHARLSAEYEAAIEENLNKLCENYFKELKTAITHCRQLRADGCDDPNLIDGILDTLDFPEGGQAQTTLAIALCVGCEWTLAETEEIMERNGQPWSPNGREDIEMEIESQEGLSMLENGRVVLLEH